MPHLAQHLDELFPRLGCEFGGELVVLLFPKPRDAGLRISDIDDPIVLQAIENVAAALPHAKIAIGQRADPRRRQVDRPRNRRIAQEQCGGEP